MVHSDCMLLTFGLLIFCFQDAYSEDVYPTRCTLTPTIGTCDHHLPRYFFSTGVKTCMMFVYTGCGGNDNNFESLNECIRQCQSRGGTPDICNLPAKVGRCKASFPRFYFNPKTRNCEKFYYGGCGGNKNNFVYWSQCRATCQNTVLFPEKCILRPRVGPCETPTIRFFFDTITGTCTMFVYSGCWGNENNFISEEVCLNECKTTG